MRGPHFCRNSFWFHWTRRLSEQLDHPFHSPIGQRLPLLDPLLEPRPVTDAFVDCARRTQVYKGEWGPRRGRGLASATSRIAVTCAMQGSRWSSFVSCLSSMTTQWESLLTSYPPSEIEMHQSQGLERPRRPAEGGGAGRRAGRTIRSPCCPPPLAISIWSVK